MKLSLRIAIAAVVVIISLACGSGKQAAFGSNSADALLAGSPANPKSSVPPCILKMIDSSKKLDPALQLTEVFRYQYNGATVYLIGAPCCDQFNTVYDSACNYLFSPSGGFTGKGDRSHPDFFTEAKADSLIWRKEK